MYYRIKDRAKLKYFYSTLFYNKNNMGWKYF